MFQVQPAMHLTFCTIEPALKGHPTDIEMWSLKTGDHW